MHRERQHYFKVTYAGKYLWMELGYTSYQVIDKVYNLLVSNGHKPIRQKLNAIKNK